MIARAEEAAKAVGSIDDAFARMAETADAAAGLVDAAMSRAADSAGKLAKAMSGAGAGAGAAAAGEGKAAQAAAAMSGSLGGASQAAEGAARALAAEAGAAKAASAASAELGRTAAYLNATFGIVVASSDRVMLSNSRLAALNQGVAESFGNIRQQAQFASLTDAQLAGMNSRLADSYTGVARAAFEAAGGEKAFRDASLGQGEALVGAAGAMADYRAKLAGLRTLLVDIYTGEAKAGDAATAAGAAAGASYRIWGTGIRLTGQALHWLVMGTLEVASTAIPALVALGAAAAGMFPAFVHISDTIHNLVVASGSMSGAMRNSVGPVADLSQHIGSLQASMAPDAYIIFGSVIQDLTGSFGSFSGVAQQAGNVLAGFATKITQDLQGGAGAQVAAFFRDSVKYMIQWGQVLGNLGHGFLNVMTSMFGVGQLLLDVLVVLSRAFLALTSNPVIAWLIGVTAAMSALYRYSRLMVTVWGLLGGSALVSAIRGVVGYTTALAALAAEEGVVAAASLALGDLMTVALGPVGLAIAAVGAAMGVWYLATHNTDSATNNLIKRVQSMPPTVANLTSGIHQLESAVHRNGQAMQHWDGIAQSANDKAAGMAYAMGGTAKSDIDKLTATIRKQELELLNLEIGLAQAGAGTGAVAAGENAMAISTALADSKVQQLNQALDQYMQLVTGGTGNLAAFTNSLANIGTVAGSVRNNLGKSTIQMSLNAHQFSRALSDMGAKGASAWTNFDQVLGSTMPQMMDWFRQAKILGATTGQAVSKAALDMTAEVMKYAGSNKTAQATVLAFAQAQGLNITTWGQLQAAVKNQGAGQADLAKKVDATTIALGNLTAMARNTTTALNAQVSNALATAALKASGFQRDVTNAAQAMSTGMAVGGHSATYWLGLADQAQQAAGKDAVTMAQNMSTSAGQAGQAAGKIAGAADGAAQAFDRAKKSAMNMQTFIDSMHGTTIPVVVAFSQTGSPPPVSGSTYHHMASGGTARPGLALVGEEGPELMLMRGGEHVFTAHQTRHMLAMASLAKTLHGYAGGTASAKQKAAYGTLRSELSQLHGYIGTDTTVNSLVHDLARAGVLIARIRSEEAHGTITTAEARKLLSEADHLRGRALHREHAIEHSKAEQIARGVTGLARATSAKDVRTDVKTLLSEIRADFRHGDITGREETRLVRFLTRDNKRLQHLAQERGKILARIKAAEAYGKQVTQAAEQSASLSGIVSAAGGGPVSSSYLLASLRIDLAGIRRFDSDIRRLEKLGLDRALINQIIQMGPVQGDQVAQALINGPLSNIKALNATESQVQKASVKLGHDAGNIMFDSGKQAGKGFLSGLEAEQKNIEKLMERMARDMARTLRRELKAHSPSQVTRDIAHDFWDGFMLGSAERAPHVASAVRSAAGHLPSALSSAAGGAAGGTLTVEATIPVTLTVDGRQLYKAVQTQTLRVDRRNGDNRLSVTRGRG